MGKVVRVFRDAWNSITGHVIENRTPAEIKAKGYMMAGYFTDDSNVRHPGFAQIGSTGFLRVDIAEHSDTAMPGYITFNAPEQQAGNANMSLSDNTRYRITRIVYDENGAATPAISIALVTGGVTHSLVGATTVTASTSTNLLTHPCEFATETTSSLTITGGAAGDTWDVYYTTLGSA